MKNHIKKWDFLNQPMLTHKMAHWQSITASETMKYYSDFSRQINVCDYVTRVTMQWLLTRITADYIGKSMIETNQSMLSE